MFDCLLASRVPNVGMHVAPRQTPRSKTPGELASTSRRGAAIAVLPASGLER